MLTLGTQKTTLSMGYAPKDAGHVTCVMAPLYNPLLDFLVCCWLLRVRKRFDRIMGSASGNGTHDYW